MTEEQQIGSADPPAATDNRTARIARQLAPALEPGEQLNGAVAGMKSIFRYSRNYGRMQVIAVTDRNVYFFEQPRRNAKLQVVRKRPRSQARLDVSSGWLTLDGERVMRVRIYAKSHARQVAELVGG
jgi:hypothetical protein